MESGGQAPRILHSLAAFDPEERRCTHAVGEWVGPRASLDTGGRQKPLFLPLLGIEPRLSTL